MARNMNESGRTIKEAANKSNMSVYSYRKALEAYKNADKDLRWLSNEIAFGGRKVRKYPVFV